MILTNRLFERRQPTREAKSLYIFSEGVKREFQYFSFFKEKDSRINIEVYELKADEDNSPRGLMEIAKEHILATDENPAPKYNFVENDEVWIVLDTDQDKTNSRHSQIAQIKAECEHLDNWFVVESNPCFEVWLYYHCVDNKPEFDNKHVCSGWKSYLNASISGGFDSRRHPIYIEDAIQNSSAHFESTNNSPDVGSTEVFKLGRSILALLKAKIDKIRKEHNL